MNLSRAIYQAYETAKARGWNTIYILLDVHGTIASSSYSNDVIKFDPVAIRCLRAISKFPEISITLWTSCYPKVCTNIVTLLNKKGVYVEAVNRSLVANTKTGDFRKKPYFSILIDDKAGFDPLDWPSTLAYFRACRKRFKLRRR